MYKLLIIVSLFLIGCSSNPRTTNSSEYIRISANGSDDRQALQNAFITAIEQETGTLILSERESENYKIIKHDILSYSSGYIDDYKIISVTRFTDSVTVIADIKVSESKLKSRILAKSQSNEHFDNNKHFVQYRSYLDQREQSDKLLTQVFHQYPEKAFNISQNSYSIEIDSNRNAIVKIPFKFSWNHNFLIATKELFENISDVNKLYTGQRGYVNVIVRKPNEVIGKHYNFAFNDLQSIRTLNMVLERNQPMIKVTALSINREHIHESCISPKYFTNSRMGEEFYTIRDTTTDLIGNTDVRGQILLTFPPPAASSLNKIVNIVLSVVSKNKC